MPPLPPRSSLRPGAKRPNTVIAFEPLLIEAAGAEVTLLHAGRSSQDMHATYRAAILRDDPLNLADQLHKTRPWMLLTEGGVNTYMSSAMINSAMTVLRNWNTILGSLVISPERAMEELNSDWTASQELADVLMRKYKLPFRVGHHFASEVVDFAKLKGIRPLDFPYAEARRIYAEAVKALHG